MLVRNLETLARIRDAFRESGAAKSLRSYYLAQYQIEIVDILAETSGQSKAAILRLIFDEWIEKTTAGAE